VAEQVEESSPEVPAQGKSSKWILYTIAVVPVAIMLAFLLVTRVINPRFAPPPAEALAGETKEESYEDEEGYLCQIGTVLANPSGAGSRRIVKLGVLIEVIPKSLVEEVEKWKPKLHHQTIMILSSKDLDTLSTPEGKSALQEELKNAFVSELRVPPEEIRRVYFNDFVIQ
jgi:flagellar basal body-associated protein FliL